MIGEEFHLWNSVESRSAINSSIEISPDNNNKITLFHHEILLYLLLSLILEPIPTDTSL